MVERRAYPLREPHHDVDDRADGVHVQRAALRAGTRRRAVLRCEYGARGEKRPRRFDRDGGELQAAVMRPPARLPPAIPNEVRMRSEEHTSELQSLRHLVCRLLLEKKKKT